jgi:hypothetical protein
MKLQPIRIAIVEPNGADVHWFRLSAKEARCAIDVVHYSTGVSALGGGLERADGSIRDFV